MSRVSEGDIVLYKPKRGEFPTGEDVRRAFVETFDGDEIVVRQCSDGFTNRITEEQITCVTTGGAD